MKKTKPVTKKTKKNTLVRYVNPEVASHYDDTGNEVFVYLGEIPQMPGHCVVVDRAGQVWWGRHTDSYEIVPDEEA